MRADVLTTIATGRRWAVPKSRRSCRGPAGPTGAVPILGHVEKRAWGGRLAWSTAIFSLATGLSRILGLVREIVAAYFFGTRGAINAFTVAFQIPNLIRAIVADAALSSAFVPVFTELHEKGERERAWRVASSLIWLLLLGLSALTALFILLAPLIIPLFGLPASQEDLAVHLSQILFPIIVLLGISGIVVGILNSYEHFTVPALTPVFWNLAIIVGLLIGVPRAGSEDAELYVYAGSILVATVIQLLLPLPWLAWRDGQLRAVIGVFFASRYIEPEIAPTAIDKAFRIYMLPQGMFSVAVATVLFPRLARLAARADMDEFRHTVSLGLRQIGFLLIPASATFAVLAHPIVRLLYEPGGFEPDQTPVVANALASFSLGLAFNGAMLMLNRAFFSLQAPWIPTVVALANLALNTALNFALYRVGTWGIPLATSIANIVGTALLLIVLRRRLGGIEFADTASSGLRVLLASVPLAVISYLVWRVLDDALGRSFVDQLLSLGSALLVGVVVYIISARLLRVRELDALLTLRSAFRRA